MQSVEIQRKHNLLDKQALQHCLNDMHTSILQYKFI